MNKIKKQTINLVNKQKHLITKKNIGNVK